MNELLEILTLDSYKLIAFVLEYLVIFAAICADLSAGLRKAKRDGKMRTSFGFRKTLEKINQYYSVALFLSFLDVLQMYLVGGLMDQMGMKLFAFPIVTFIATIYICIIEYKSIKEKRDVKENARIEEVTRLLSSILKDEKNVTAVENLISTLKKIKDVNES